MCSSVGPLREWWEGSAVARGSKGPRHSGSIPNRQPSRQEFLKICYEEFVALRCVRRLALATVSAGHQPPLTPLEAALLVDPSSPTLRSCGVFT